MSEAALVAYAVRFPLWIVAAVIIAAVLLVWIIIRKAAP
jgi:hypothetical protein